MEWIEWREADPVTGWMDSKPAPREEAPDWSAIDDRTRTEIRSQRGRHRAAALIVLIFPMSAGGNIFPRTLGGKRVSSFSAAVRSGRGRWTSGRGIARSHPVEVVSEVAASGESAVLSTSAFAIQMQRRES